MLIVLSNERRHFVYASNAVESATAFLQTTVNLRTKSRMETRLMKLINWILLLSLFLMSANSYATGIDEIYENTVDRREWGRLFDYFNCDLYGFHLTDLFNFRKPVHTSPAPPPNPPKPIDPDIIRFGGFKIAPAMWQSKIEGLDNIWLRMYGADSQLILKVFDKHTAYLDLMYTVHPSKEKIQLPSGNEGMLKNASYLSAGLCCPILKNIDHHYNGLENWVRNYAFLGSLGRFFIFLVDFERKYNFDLFVDIGYEYLYISPKIQGYSEKINKGNGYLGFGFEYEIVKKIFTEADLRFVVDKNTHNDKLIGYDYGIIMKLGFKR